MPRRGGWRWLGMFWVATILAGAGAAATLQHLGPPPGGPEPQGPAHEVQGHEAGPAHAPARPVGALPGLPARPGWNGHIADPDPAMQEPSRNFAPATLPRIAGGRLPMQVYARPASRDDPRPRIAILLSGFGLADAESRAAIALPGPVGFAVSVYARQIDPLLDAARAAGHELLGSIPMESVGFPLNDAGYASLMVGATGAANERNLERALAHVPGVVGATGASDGFRGERFAANADSFAPVAAELGRRGLLYVDPRPGAAVAPGIAARSVDLVIDDPPARAELEAKLSALERTARAKGSAVGLAGPIRIATLERLALWMQELEARGVLLVPVSALVPAAAP